MNYLFFMVNDYSCLVSLMDTRSHRCNVYLTWFKNRWTMAGWSLSGCIIGSYYYDPLSLSESQPPPSDCCLYLWHCWLSHTRSKQFRWRCSEAGVACLRSKLEDVEVVGPPCHVPHPTSMYRPVGYPVPAPTIRAGGPPQVTLRHLKNHIVAQSGLDLTYEEPTEVSISKSGVFLGATNGQWLIMVAQDFPNGL